MSEKISPAARPFVPETASWGRRVLALLVDWLACFGVALFIFHDWEHKGFVPVQWFLFLLESSVGIALTGSSFGQSLLKIQVHTVDNRPLSLLRALGRQALILLVIPPLVFRPDGRGLHDLWTDSGAYRKA